VRLYFIGNSNAHAKDIQKKSKLINNLYYW